MDCGRGRGRIHAAHRSNCSNDAKGMEGVSLLERRRGVAPLRTGSTAVDKRVGGRRGNDLFKDPTSSQETKRPISTRCRPSRGKPRFTRETFPDGDTPKGTNVYNRDEMGNHNRPEGRVLPPSSSSFLQKIPRYKSTRWLRSQVPDTKFWSLPSSMDLHQANSPGPDHAKIKRYYLLGLFRRLHRRWRLFRGSLSHLQRGDSTSLRPARPTHQRGKKSTDSLSNYRIFRPNVRPGEGYNINSRSEGRV